jgi:transcriptional regulator with XRE-family HTH domain
MESFVENDIGKILKEKRTGLGLSVADVSKKIRIRDTFIEAIENNDTKSLPESYYDLFLKKYAGFLNVDLPEDEEKKKQKDMILEMLSESENGKKKNHPVAEFFRKILLFVYIHRKFFIGFVIGLLLFIFMRHMYLILNEDEKSEKNESMVKIITIEGDLQDKISVAVRDSFLVGDETNEYFTMKIIASDSCYIYYYSDSLEVSEIMLAPGKDLSIKAENIIEAKLGQSGAVSIEFNDEKALEDLKNYSGYSSYLRVTDKGVQRVKQSDKIGTYLKNVYGLE